MSILSATMVTAALLGAGPDLIPTQHAVVADPAGGPVIQVHTESSSTICGKAHVSCGDVVCQPACQTSCAPVGNAGCQSDGNGGSKSNGYGCCKHGRRHWCPLCGWCNDDDDCDDDCDLNCCERHCLTYCIGPGDMYPHYPYFPAYHGYYYFRPYNFEHVLKDSAIAAEMGGDPMAPYSVEFLRAVFPPAPIEPIPEYVRPHLPILEDLLTPRPYTE
jgi:hypothetical protein